MKILVTLVPIASLLFIGFLIALKSGVSQGTSWRTSRNLIVGNLSGLILRLGGFVAGLLIVQRVIGYS